MRRHHLEGRAGEVVLAQRLVDERARWCPSSSSSSSACDTRPVSQLGSICGHEASASTRPVSTSITAAAPLLCFFSAVSVRSCSPTSSVVTQIVARHRIDARLLADQIAQLLLGEVALALAARVDDHPLVAVLAAQERLPLALQPGAADVVAHVVALVALVGAAPRARSRSCSRARARPACRADSCGAPPPRRPRPAAPSTATRAAPRRRGSRPRRRASDAGDRAPSSPSPGP